MSALASPQRPAARGRIVQRAREAGRSRRAGAGTVTEMARALLRDAREADFAQGAGRRRGAPAPEGLSRSKAGRRRSGVAAAEERLSGFA